LCVQRHMAAGECGNCTVDIVFDTSRCDSCGRENEEVVAVRRVYVTPETWDTEGKVEIVDEVEHWCFSCRSHYPHQEVDEST
jgi:hypothetical protein